MTKALGLVGNIVLSVSHVAGMIDMVVLPLWVGSLMEYYAYSPAEAGGVVTLFLFSVVVASTLIAPLFERIPHRICVTAGFAVTAAAFLVISRQPVNGDGFMMMAALHVVAGFGAGSALSITHGNIGRTLNPHRLFGIVNVMLGVLGVLTFAGLPALIANFGPQVMFLAFASVMGIACLVCAAAFPESRGSRAIANRRSAMPRSAWLIMLVIICMTFNQAMIFSFLQRIGIARGFAEGSVNGVLIALGFINLVPGALAVVLQTRLSPLAVGFAGPLVQAVLALILSNSSRFLPFALSGAVFVSVLIFTHIFLFGLLSRLDTSGRCLAATPAMTMVGSCTGPAAGGFIVSTLGYQGLGWTALIVSMVALGLLTLLRLQLQARSANFASAHG